MESCDLHLHSVFSDGTHTPEEIVALGRSKNFSLLALTDHDTVDGLPRFHEAARKAGLRSLSGIEITAQIGNREVHVLGYDFDPRNDNLCREMVLQRKNRKDRIGRMVSRLQNLGIRITVEDVLATGGTGSLGRPHVGMALVALKVVNTVDEAFAKYLGNDGPAYVDKPRLTTARAIGLINDAGGVAVLAHPALARVDSSIGNMVREGLGGIEVVHVSHDESAVRKYRRMAAELGLSQTGGSDCHGMTKGHVLLGHVRFPLEECERMLRRRRTPVPPAGGV
ncbi:MAG: PHP domain-containing protein [Verrucomicrobiae bacterium]|nr:PHP domain-containing protein [Verrucomicrobiae bacterium]